MRWDRVQFAFNTADYNSVLFILLAILAILSNLNIVQFAIFDVLTLAYFPLDHFPEHLAIVDLLGSLGFLMLSKRAIIECNSGERVGVGDHGGGDDGQDWDTT